MWEQFFGDAGELQACGEQDTDGDTDGTCIQMEGKAQDIKEQKDSH